MMPSVIPARLQFQCGHAALVTLPRIKGETAAQRNDRVAREKSAALSRQCDFCAPAVAVATNGNSHSVETPAYTPEPEVMLAVAEPQATEAARVEEVNELPAEVVLEVTEPAETMVREALEATEPALTAEPTDGAAEAAAPMRMPRRRAAARKPRAEEV